jgi:WD40 repeat protein
MTYNAFISYSHSQDADLAPGIERALEKFAKPIFKRRALRIFRDSNDLSISPDLWGKIEEGLKESEYMVYCASPASANSYYCNEEVKFWLANKSINNFLVVLTDGELIWDHENNDFDWEKTTAIPKLLSGAFNNEPLYVDFRDDIPKERMNLDDADFKSKLIYIAATLHKKPVGDMVGEGVKQHKRTLRIRNAALTVVFSLMAIALFLTVSSIKRRVASQLHFQAKAMEQEDPSIALRIEAAALKRYDFSEFRNTAHSIIANNTFYKILTKNDSTYVAGFSMSAVDSTIALGYNDGRVGIMDLEGKLIQEFRAYNDEINSIAFAPDGRSVLTTNDNTAQLWNLEGNKMSDFFGHTERVNSAIFTPDGNNILTASSDGSLRLFDRSGTTIRLFVDENYAFDDVSIASDGQSFLSLTSGLDRSNVIIWSIDGIDKSVLRIPWLKAISLSPDGESILTGHADGITQLLNKQGDTIWQYQGPVAAVSTVVFAPDGETILSASANGDGRKLDRSGKLLNEFKGHHEPIIKINFTTDGKSVITASFDGTLRLWQLERIEKAAIQEFNGLKGWVNTVGFSHDGKQVLAGDENGDTFLWDLNGNPAKRMEGQKYGVGLAAFTNNGKSILTTSQGGAIARLWDLKSEEPTEFEQDLMHYHPVAISPDGSTIFLGANMVAGGILWDLNTNTTKEFKDLRFDSAAFSPDGRSILVGCKDGKARLFDEEGGLIKEYDAHGYVFTSYDSYPVTSLAFTEDGTTIAMGSEDGTIRISNLKGRVLANFKAHEDTVNSLSFSPDGRSLLSVSYDKTARLWDLRGTLLSDFSRQTGEVSAMAFSPDGKSFLAGGAKGKVQLIRFIKVEEFLDNYVQPLNKEQRELYEVD